MDVGPERFSAAAEVKYKYRRTVWLSPRRTYSILQLERVKLRWSSYFDRDYQVQHHFWT